VEPNEIAVGRESDVAEPGSFLTHDGAGVPVLVTRDHGGRLHAMLNVCRHRGTRLVFARAGVARSLVCTQHAWTYDLCGRLASPSPHEHEAAPSRCADGETRDPESALVELPLAIRDGVIWVVVPERGAIT
jgi:phenylpropionate dioxygenase-like ring-hydroxylating dioxygenase large terminal subunit